MFSRLPVKKLSRQSTSLPSPRSRSQRCEPMNPAPPVTKIRIANPPIIFSLCNLCVLCVSVVVSRNTTETQRTQRLHREEGHHLRTAKFPRYSTSIFVLRKHSIASCGVQTIGSFSLNDVLRITGTPVNASKSEIN